MKCKYCNRHIETEMVLCCSCGTFCNAKCQYKYHDAKSKQGETK